MTAQQILLYQIGNAAAIRAAADNRRLPLIGAILVLITSIPRNYDQSYIGDTPWWPLIPLVFSFFSGAFLYFFVRRGVIRHAFGEGSSNFFWRFLGLFWLTAPIAWLYAIPVERFLAARAATVANLYLLGIVAVWRIVLLTQVVTVLFNASRLRAAGWVLLGASAEVLLIVVGEFFFQLGPRVMQGMGGMRNSPEETLLAKVLGVIFWLSLAAIPASYILVKTRHFYETLTAPPPPASNRVPVMALAVAGVLWIVLAIAPQRELRNEAIYVKHLRAERFDAALGFLARLRPEDWPPAKPFRPNPYEYEVWRWLPQLVEHTTGREQPWIREALLESYAATFIHLRGFRADEHLRMLQAVERFPESAKWFAAHKSGLEKISRKMAFKTPNSDAEEKVRELLAPHGIALWTEGTASRE